MILPENELQQVLKCFCIPLVHLPIIRPWRNASRHFRVILPIYDFIWSYSESMNKGYLLYRLTY